MAGEHTLPGLGLTAFWDLGDNTYKTGTDTNWRKVSALVQPRVKSIEAATPGGAVQGDIYLASAVWSGGSANDIMLYDLDDDDLPVWVPITPSEGWKVYNEGTGKDMFFDGTNWLYSGDPRFVLVAAASYSLLETDLDGRTVIEVSNGGAVTFTLTAGLAGLGPVTVINTGGGDIAFTEDTGVTRQSTFPNLKTQWGWATIIPKGSDVFHIGGNLEAA